MRAVVQRVSRAAVRVDGETISSIGAGLVVLVGIAEDDDADDALYLAEKVATLRVFPDAEADMNRSVGEADGEVLVVSQFTLLGDARRGRRPSFIHAARPEPAEPLVRHVAETLRAAGLTVGEGRFGAMMDVELVNDGPVTILLDTRRAF